jgi:1,4-alpha-glucan branching enzyme
MQAGMSNTFLNLRVRPVKHNSKNLIWPLNNFIENRRDQVQVEVRASTKVKVNTKAKVEVNAGRGKRKAEVKAKRR